MPLLSATGTDGPRPDARPGRAASGERLLSLLTTANGCAPPSETLLYVDASRIAFDRGEQARAHILLALVKLPRLDEHAGFRAYLAARLLRTGLTAARLLEELNLGSSSPLHSKYAASQARVPAGAGASSGQWTSNDNGDPGASASPRTTRSEQIQVAITCAEHIQANCRSRARGDDGRDQRRGAGWRHLHAAPVSARRPPRRRRRGPRCASSRRTAASRTR